MYTKDELQNNNGKSSGENTVDQPRLKPKGLLGIFPQVSVDSMKNNEKFSNRIYLFFKTEEHALDLREKFKSLFNSPLRKPQVRLSYIFDDGSNKGLELEAVPNTELESSLNNYEDHVPKLLKEFGKFVAISEVRIQYMDSATHKPSDYCGVASPKLV